MTKPPVLLNNVPLKDVKVGDEMVYPNGGTAGEDAYGVIIRLDRGENSVKITWDGYSTADYNISQRSKILWLGPMIAENIE